MKDITLLKQQFQNSYANHFCHVQNVNKCPHGKCLCKASAQIKAYIESVIPNGYRDFVLNDFNGMDRSGKVIIPQNKLKIAKSKLVQYCWNDLSSQKYDNMSAQQMSRYSSISKRRSQGKNAFIYAKDTGQKSGGRTMIASIIMKQAIRNRVKSDKKSESYCWAQYSVLRQQIINDRDSASDARFSDWLVVDDIAIQSHGTKGQKGFISAKLDPFFQQRIQDGLPTIFVFRFDTKAYRDVVQQTFGVAISKIVGGQNSIQIPLN